MTHEIYIYIYCCVVVSKESRPSSLLPALRACRKQQFLMAMYFASKKLRSFSGLRRLKTYLRSTMKEDRLNGLALLMVHRSISISINKIIDVLITFASTQQRRMMLALILMMQQKLVIIKTMYLIM